MTDLRSLSTGELERFLTIVRQIEPGSKIEDAILSELARRGMGPLVQSELEGTRPR